jgi:hypothetical protein
MVDIDGVVSLFGFPPHSHPDGTFHSIDGILHFLSSAAAAHLLALVSVFDLVWCSGWEEKANEYLPHLLNLPASLPFLRFSREAGGTRAASAHWKLDAIDDYAGTRPLAWIDDAFDESCHEWSAARPAATLLVRTSPAVGLTARETDLLLGWSRQLAVEAS